MFTRRSICKTGPGRGDNAVGKVWGGGIQIIRDEVTQAGAGQVIITARSLYDFAVVRTAGYYELGIQDLVTWSIGLAKHKAPPDALWCPVTKSRYVSAMHALGGKSPSTRLVGPRGAYGSLTTLTNSPRASAILVLKRSRWPLIGSRSSRLTYRAHHRYRSHPHGVASVRWLGACRMRLPMRKCAFVFSYAGPDHPGDLCRRRRATSAPCRIRSSRPYFCAQHGGVSGDAVHEWTQIGQQLEHVLTQSPDLPPDRSLHRRLIPGPQHGHDDQAHPVWIVCLGAAP